MQKNDGNKNDRFYWMKKIKRKVLHKLSHRIIKRDFHQWCKNHPDLPTYSQYKQDLFVQYFYRNNTRDNLFFVDIGANDGITFSNTFALEKNANWGGVLIEADSQVFQKLLINRPNTPKHNIAVYHKDEMIEFMQVSGYAQMLSGIVSEYDKRHLERIKNEVKEMGGKCRIVSIQGARFDSVMADYGVKTIDYLSIDVEGGEMKILESIDFNEFDIALIGVENNYGDSNIAYLLSRYGYKKIVNLGCDEFYAKTQLC